MSWSRPFDDPIQPPKGKPPRNPQRRSRLDCRASIRHDKVVDGHFQMKTLKIGYNVQSAVDTKHHLIIAHEAKVATGNAPGRLDASS